MGIDLDRTEADPIYFARQVSAGDQLIPLHVLTGSPYEMLIESGRDDEASLELARQAVIERLKGRGTTAESPEVRISRDDGPEIVIGEFAAVENVELIVIGRRSGEDGQLVPLGSGSSPRTRSCDRR